VANRTVNRLSRGDRRRNAKLRQLRSLVRPDLAICAVDLADANQAAVVADHDSVVLGRRMFHCSAWGIDQILDWAIPIAQQAGFAGVVVACEPTGHRWKPVAELARARGLHLVCVQPLLVHRAREGEDFTRDRSDYKDATIIARLTSERRCYRPEVTTPTWARLRHLGRRRAAVLQAATAARQALGDLLGISWPSVLAVAAQPLDSLTVRACLAVATDPAVTAAMGDDAFAQAVAAQLPRWGGTRRRHQIMRAVSAAAQTPGGVAAERAAAAERASFAVADWQRALQQLGEVQGRMVAVLDQLHLTRLVTTIPAQRGRRRRGPGRDRRPGPLRHRQNLGQARRAVPTRQHLGPVPGPDHHLRAGPARAAHRRLAGDLGPAAPQPGLRRPLRPPDRPGPQPAQRRPSPGRARRGPAASAPRGLHPPGGLGPQDRRGGGDRHRRVR
jgi:Transposase